MKYKFSIAKYLPLFILTAMLCVTGGSLWWAFRPHPKARPELLHFRSQVRLGDNKQKVQATFSGNECSSLRLSTSQRPSIWVVATPTHLTGKNWLLWIDFEKEKVVGLRIRYLDSETMKPQSSPSDLR